MVKTRRRLPSFLLVVVALALGAAPAGAAPSVASSGNCVPGADWPAANGSLATQVIALVNEHRSDLGLTPFTVSSSLTSSAVWKARHMAAYGYMAHNDPAPPISRSVGERLAACGYSGGGWGENIAYGYPTPEQVVTAWLASSGHRANIENPSFKAIGVGAAATASGVQYWAQNFGTTAGGSPPPFTPDPDPTPPDPGDPPAGGGSPPSGGGGSELVVPPDTEVDAPPTTGGPQTPPGDETPEPTAAEPVSLRIELSALRIQVGKAMAPSPSSLEEDDLHSLAVRSRTGRTAWQARFGLTDAALEAGELALTFRGASTLPCRQTISVWSPERKVWVIIDRRRLGSRETEVEDVIEETAGSQGRVLLRVVCERSDNRPFTTRADLLTIES